MATVTRDLSTLFRRPVRSGAVCSRCRRTFATSPLLQSGHNKWSKIKHQKGRQDHIKTVERTQHVQAITLYSRLYGPDPNTNSSLANAIAIAKKSATPKNVIEQAVARGQGRSLTGLALESMKFEVMMPPSAAFILDVETDSKLRVLQDLGVIIRKHKGRTTATDYFFSRRGRVVFERHEKLGPDDILEAAIEFGAEDLEADDEENIVVWCEPTQTMHIAQGVSKKFGFRILSSDIIWQPNEDTRSIVNSTEDVQLLSDFVAAVSEMPEVQAIYCNASRGEDVPEEDWAVLEDNFDS
ncbi:hypothetical protein M406DRAFT_34799 [Cryphonectria parasitica EP155]|uniref:Uncharacterized protein n=1 Tax=Cryphonectria parasitica (strain ATCC 38755 / EP155) TaxID=660469 RepID=A0A9P4YCY6_CRYP1|nr:uncharacterized protein M406DRAFT_34799 [Cryphonectria parasitica EP155]KAF3770370.1 hypothetical protein M406DRAFT_34799 [Cryphonectria parasitica EP155]